MQYIVHTPVNSLSLGNVGFNLLKESYKAGHDVGWFPVGQSDLSAFKVDQPFVNWLQEAANKRYSFLGKGLPALCNWHLNGSERLYSDKQILLTYTETSSPTPTELSIASNQYKTLFCGAYSEKVFRAHGLTNVGSFNLGLDEEIYPTGKKYLEGKISFGLIGKWESRKFTERLIKLWVAKYGNNPKYALNLLIYNPFYSPEDNNRLIAQALGGKRFFNVNLLPRLTTNAEMNELYNSNDIDISGLGSESWALPSFNATCLGKWSVVLNGGGQKAWATEENAILVEPSGMRPCYDDAFFKQGQEFNQGDFFEVSDESIIDAFERAEKKVGTINQIGLDLGKQMSYSKTLESILSHV